MTGQELIDWIKTNHAENLVIAYDYSAYETETQEVEEVKIEDDSNDIYSNVRAKHIHFY